MIDLIPSMEKYVRNTGNIFLALLDLGKKKKEKEVIILLLLFPFPFLFSSSFTFDPKKKQLLYGTLRPVEDRSLKELVSRTIEGLFINEKEEEEGGEGLGFYRTAFRRECLVERGRGVFLEPTSPKTRDFWETPSSPDPPW